MPNPRDPDNDVLPIPFFELNSATMLFWGKRNSEGTEFRPFVGVITEGIPAARSDFFEDAHLVVFGLRFCLNLYAHFQTLLSHPGVFQGIGNAENDIPRVVWNNDDTDNDSALLYFGEPREGEMFGPLSSNPERIMLATRLYHWAMRFIGYHEIAHLALGHVHLLNSELGSARIDDDAETYRSSGYTRLRRALEQQADLHAMQRMTAVALIDSKRPGLPQDVFKYMIFEMMYAMIAVMRMWSRGQRFSRDGTVDTYPHPAVRFTGLVAALRNYIDSWELSKDDSEAWVYGMGLSLIETAVDDEVLRCQEPLVDWINDSDGLKNAFDEIREDFRIGGLKEKLARFAFATAYDASKVLD